jgi:hypothetical protein
MRRRPLWKAPQEVGTVYISRLFGKNHFRTIFTVGVQSFTLAEGGPDQADLDHCRFIQKMFVLAVRKAGMRVVLRKKVKDTR